MTPAPRSILRRALLTAAVGALALAGCKEKAAPPSTSTPPSARAANTIPAAKPVVPAPGTRAANATPPALTIQPAKLDLVRSGLAEVMLDGEGTVSVAGKPLAKLSADGKLTKPDGTPIAELAADGSVTFAGIDNAPVVEIDERGSIKLDGEDFLKIEDDGSVWKRTADGKLENDGLAVFDGPPATRRALALVMVAMVASGSAPPPPPPTSR